jgi:hypothetical protein
MAGALLGLPAGYGSHRRDDSCPSSAPVARVVHNRDWMPAVDVIAEVRASSPAAGEHQIIAVIVQALRRGRGKTDVFPRQAETL